ncbi:MAG: twin-arginine translocase subunit TatC [Isosphaeraceae bacterium]
MPNDQDLFNEEQEMVAMSFGEHIEELRLRLILALFGLIVGVIVTFLPPLNLGWRVITQMQEPAKGALQRFYAARALVRAEDAAKKKKETPPIAASIPADLFVAELRKIIPGATLPEPEAVKGQTLRFPINHDEAGMIMTIARDVEGKDALISLAPLETMTIFFGVCLVTGLVIASPWVFYQIWAFVAAGLYRHEQHYVKKFLPISLGLFLAGVFLCFFGVLPITLSFLLEFNVWLGIEPTLRLADWMSFATVLPLVFGVCFQTPLVMLFLERIGVFTVEDYRAKRKFAILVIVIAGAILTPGQDPFSQCLLAVPMIVLYELGILLIGRQRSRELVKA